MKTHWRRFFIVFIVLIVSVGCSAERVAYSKSARRVQIRELNKQNKLKQKAIMKRYKDHIKHQSPAMKKIMKKKLREMRREMRRKRR